MLLKGTGPWSCVRLPVVTASSYARPAFSPALTKGREPRGQRSCHWHSLPSLHKGKEHLGTWPRCRHSVPTSASSLPPPDSPARLQGGRRWKKEMLGLGGMAALETTRRNLGVVKPGSSRGLLSRCFTKQGFTQVFLGEVFMGWIGAENLTNSANWFVLASVLCAFSHRTRS